jgi:hypothetical protein
MSIMAASLYSFQASAFLAICSASALALASIAKASASPVNKTYPDHLFTLFNVTTHLRVSSSKENCPSEQKKSQIKRFLYWDYLIQNGRHGQRPAHGPHPAREAS